jgi:acetoin utilization protein AcuB
MATIEKIMTTKITTIPSGSTLAEAHNIMRDKRIRHLPVVESDGGVIGILSQRDINAVPDSKSIIVDWMMSTPVRYIASVSSIKQAVFKMLENKISCLLVVNEDDESVEGIVTTDDMLWYLVENIDENDKSEYTVKDLIVSALGQASQNLSSAGI